MPHRMTFSLLVSLPSLLLLSTIANAQHRPHQAPTPYPFRCPRAGICLEATGNNSVVGGVRHEDAEIRFHAIRQVSQDDDSEAFCVVITDTDLNVIATSGDRSRCEGLDQDDETLFGVKPTTTKHAKRTSDVSDVTIGCVQHLLEAEIQPDHAEGWGAIQSLAQRWFKEQNAKDGEAADDRRDPQEQREQESK